MHQHSVALGRHVLKVFLFWLMAISAMAAETFRKPEGASMPVTGAGHFGLHAASDFRKRK
ncbi:MAG: hypothetical protein KIT13_03895 [Burkholderiales bacterium]|nr:hypothetical protein [Burkholderiales bacterium]